VRRAATSWNVSSRSPSKDVNVHFRELLARIAPAANRIEASWGEPSFGVTWKGSYLYAGSGPFYEPDVLAGIAALSAALYQDIFQIDQDEDELETLTKLKRLPRWL
jgi:hypothetical protein